MGWLLMSRRFTLFLFVIIFAVIGLLPIVQMFINSIVVDNHISFVNYQTLLSSNRSWILLKNSLALSLLTTVLATALGVPLGLLFGKTNLPLKNLLVYLFMLPLLLPPYITAVAWFTILGRGGILSSVLGANITERTSFFLFGLPGCVLVLFTTLMPIVMLLTITYVKTINLHLEEAARLVARWGTVIRGIIIPMILPGILLSSILVFLLALGEVSVPMFLRYDVFPVESFTQFSAFYNYSTGTAFVIPLIIITFFVLWGERRFLRDKTYQVKTASGEETLLVSLGNTQWLLFTVVSIFCFVLVILPIAALVIQSASLSTYLKAFERSSDSLLRSIYYACLLYTSPSPRD